MTKTDLVATLNKPAGHQPVLVGREIIVSQTFFQHDYYGVKYKEIIFEKDSIMR